jgi:hypothetical protein
MVPFSIKMSISQIQASEIVFRVSQFKYLFDFYAMWKNTSDFVIRRLRVDVSWCEKIDEIVSFRATGSLGSGRGVKGRLRQMVWKLNCNGFRPIIHTKTDHMGYFQELTHFSKINFQYRYRTNVI